VFQGDSKCPRCDTIFTPVYCSECTVDHFIEKLEGKQGEPLKVPYCAYCPHKVIREGGE